MSYCVNCGVELAPSEKKCPLCGVPVINPANPWSAPDTRPYPKAADIAERIDTRYMAQLIALILLIPVLLTIIGNLMISHEISWSLYVVGAGFCIFLWVLLPLILRSTKPYLAMVIDTVALLLYLALISWMTAQFSWYLPLALPLGLAVGVFSIAVTFVVRRKKLSKLIMAALVSLLTGAFAVAVELIIKHYIGMPEVQWSVFVLLPCMMIAIVLAIIQKNKRLKDAMIKRLFI